MFVDLYHEFSFLIYSKIIPLIISNLSKPKYLGMSGNDKVFHKRVQNTNVFGVVCPVSL